MGPFVGKSGGAMSGDQPKAAADEFKLPATPPKADNLLTHAGLVLTIVWLLVLLVYWLSNRPAFWELKPNEMGDFFAGAFAPLAFLWLVLGFFQQGKELRHSGEALWLQGRELQHSVDQQRELVRVTREQFALDGSMARPILRARANYFEKERWDGTDTVEFHVENHGELCTDLAIDCEYLLKRSLRNALHRGEHMGMSFRKPSEAESVEVEVTYKDLRGVPGKAIFLVSVEGDGLMVFDKEATASSMLSTPSVLSPTGTEGST